MIVGHKPHQMTVVIGTNTGIVRSHNEDMAMTIGPLVVVADGMGGLGGGDVASAVAARSIEDSWLAAPPDQSAGEAEVTMWLEDALQRANVKVLAVQQLMPVYWQMGSAIVAVLFHKEAGCAHLVHVGDCRAYLLRRRKLRRANRI